MTVDTGATAETTTTGDVGVELSYREAMRTALHDGPPEHRRRDLRVLEKARESKVRALLPDLEALAASASADPDTRDRALRILEEHAPTPYWAELDLR